MLRQSATRLSTTPRPILLPISMIGIGAGEVSHSCNDSLRSRDSSRLTIKDLLSPRCVLFLSAGSRVLPVAFNFFVRPVTKKFHSKGGQDIKSGGDAKQSLCP